MLEVHFLKNSDKVYKSFGREIISYNHVNGSNGGNDSASIQLSVNKLDMLELADWLLGTKVEVYINNTTLIWSGIVNDLSISFGAEQITYGPLLEVSNKVLVKYTEYTTGVPGVTTYANDLISQDKYGLTIYKILNAGSVSAINADKIRDRYLYENAYHKISKTISASGALSFNVNCIGYYQLLGTYIYNSDDGPDIDLSYKIKSVVAEQPNDIYLTDFFNIETNELSVNGTENQDRLAIDIIKELVALGSQSTNDRTIFGFIGNKPYYKTISYITKYYLDNSSRNPVVTNQFGRFVEPWNIEPGYFIESIDNIPYPNDKIYNQKIAFIESVNYTYPYTFQISTGNSNTLSQQLAKLGLGGL